MNRPHRPLSDFTVANENVEYNRQKLCLQQTTNKLALIITYTSGILAIEKLHQNLSFATVQTASKWE
jgi:hypothetical protein